MLFSRYFSMKGLLKIFFIYLIVSHLNLVAAEALPSVILANDTNLIPQNDSLTTWVYHKLPSGFPSLHKPLDTNTWLFQRYDPLLKHNVFVATHAQMGLPNRNLSSLIHNQNPFQVGNQFFGDYFFNINNIPFYKLMKPYSEFEYVMGPNQENFLQITFGNQLSPGLYVGMDFRGMSGTGGFLYQVSRENSFRLNVQAQTPSKRYNVGFQYIRNHASFDENGGLVNDSYYQDTTKLDRRILDVQLSTAENLLNTQHLSLVQSYALRDSNARWGSLVWENNYKTSYRIYSESEDARHYYRNSYLDTISSFDSTQVVEYQTFFGWQKIAENLGFSMRLGMQYEYFQYFTGKTPYFYNYWGPKASFRWEGVKSKLNGRVQLKIPLVTNFENYGNGDLDMHAFYRQRIQKHISFNVSGDYQLKESDISMHHQYSNHFQWDQNLKKLNVLKLGGGLDLFGYQAHLGISNYANYSYYDDSLEVQTDAKGIQIMQISLQKELKGKRGGVSLAALYQEYTNKGVLHLPKFMGRLSANFNFKLFKGALFAYPGVDVYYLSSYYADGYNPALMAFHLQNEKKIDPQVYVDLFINFKVKRARIFLMYKNANMLLGNYNFFLIQHYPMQDAGLKIGVSWRFYD